MFQLVFIYISPDEIPDDQKNKYNGQYDDNSCWIQHFEFICQRIYEMFKNWRQIWKIKLYLILINGLLAL